jgi:hypothetical protein
MDQSDLTSVLAKMTAIDTGLDYYAITMIVDSDGKDWTITQTMWAGWADEDKRVELRVPSLVRPEAFARIWALSAEPYLVVNDDRSWFVYFCLGGHALVEEQIAEKFLGGTFRKMRTEGAVQKTGQLGFVPLSSLPKHAVQRAPTPKLRMEVFNRDKRRCRICGSSPANNEVELHIHHIRPWEHGGLTYTENLITLCHTCHKGLDPHEDRSLVGLLPPLKPGGTHDDNVLRYRERVWREIAAYDDAIVGQNKARSPKHRWKRRGRQG